MTRYIAYLTIADTYNYDTDTLCICPALESVCLETLTAIERN